MSILFWSNPFEHYQGHALTRVYRHTADEFNNAVQLGMSAGISYVDLQVEGDTTYYYWIRWESTGSELSNPSESLELTPAIDPAEAIEDLTEEIEDDPLTATLLEENNADTIQRIRERIGQLQAYLIDSIRKTALDNAIVTLDDYGVTLADYGVTLGLYEIGEAPNTFSGATLAAAETELDDYTDDSANATWLAGYDDDPLEYVILEYD